MKGQKEKLEMVLSVRISLAQYKKLAAIANDEYRTVSNLANSIIGKYLKKK